MMSSWIETLIKEEYQTNKASTYDSISSEHLILMVGKGLIPLIDPKKNGPLLKRIQSVRKYLLFKHHISIQGVRVCDDLILGDYAYMIGVQRGDQILCLSRGEIVPNSVFFSDLKTMTPSEKQSKSIKKMINPITSKKGVWLDLDDESLSNENVLDSLSTLDYISSHFHVIAEQYLIFYKKTKMFNLTRREIDILRTIIEGKKNSDMAKDFVISISTVKRHIESILKKTKLNSKVKLIALFYT